MDGTVAYQIPGPRTILTFYDRIKSYWDFQLHGFGDCFDAH